MGCATCTNNVGGVPAGCKSNGSCGNGGCNKLTVFNWLSNMKLPNDSEQFKFVEVRFKNNRKEFFENTEKLSLYEGDTIAVEAQNGYDIGFVTLTGELVRLQMQKKKVFINKDSEVKKIFRKATEKDIEKWQDGKGKEAKAMIRAREIALEFSLEMKISDVEYQGDCSKATFYYTAEARVDFRELIRKLADTFKIRIEMKQIGMRQEAGRLGGIGSCGRELCCSTWLTDFRSVSTSAARYQQLSLNPSKLAGQCGKLKCCLNFELDAYVDELKKFPNTRTKLKTEKGDAFFQKMDIFKQKMWYSYKETPYDFVELSLDWVTEIIDQNKEGKKVAELKDPNAIVQEVKIDYANVVGQDDLTRFDKSKPKRKNNKRRSNRKPFKKKTTNASK